jgi:thiamine-monophosphate kinase
MSPEFARLHPPAARLTLQAGGGDDYELCICLPPSLLAEARAKLEVPLTVIGHIVAGTELDWRDAAGNVIEGPMNGYRHF